jgi:hypothetical protein
VFITTSTQPRAVDQSTYRRDWAGSGFHQLIIAFINKKSTLCLELLAGGKKTTNSYPNRQKDLGECSINLVKFCIDWWIFRLVFFGTLVPGQKFSCSLRTTSKLIHLNGPGSRTCDTSEFAALFNYLVMNLLLGVDGWRLSRRQRITPYSFACLGLGASD